MHSVKIMYRILREIKNDKLRVSKSAILINDHPYYFIIVQCPPGTYQQQNNCIMCPFGTYQPQDGQYTCKPCGPQKSTKFPASKSNQDCVGKLCNKQIFGWKSNFWFYHHLFFHKNRILWPWNLLLWWAISMHYLQDWLLPGPKLISKLPKMPTEYSYLEAGCQKYSRMST